MKCRVCLGGWQAGKAPLAQAPSESSYTEAPGTACVFCYDVECLPSLGLFQGLWVFWFVAMLAVFGVRAKPRGCLDRVVKAQAFVW